MSELVQTDIHDRIATVRLNAPEKVNAISLEMRVGLITALQAIFLGDECDGVVLTGSAGNFSAGGDIRSVRPAPEALVRSLQHKLGRLHELVRLICLSPKPIVSAVQGKAYGAGLSLALACDTVVAASDAQFCAAFGRVGLIPDAGLLYTLPRRIGGARAQQLMLSARVVDADEALAIGLVDQVSAPQELLPQAREAARALTRIAPLSYAAIKSLGAGGCATLEDAFAQELRLQPLLAMTDDNQEARQAFAERRRPAFRGH